MSNVIRINACLYSRMGYGRSRNLSDFYMNGRFQSEPHLDNIQASLENRGSDYLFAVADNMENAAEATANVSINRDLARIHEKISVNGGDIESKARELTTRVSDSMRLLDSILEMNHTPAEDDRRRVGFSALILADGHAVAATAGLGHVYLMREETFTSLACENTKRERLVRLGVLTEEDAEREDLLIPEDTDVEDSEPEGPVILSDPIPFCEHDTFLLVSHGAFEALGEERVEDILAGGGESVSLAGRIVAESMKRTTRGDLTALVVQIEKIYDVQGAARRPMLKSRVDALSKTPAVTYRYSRKPAGRDSILFAGLSVLTVIVVLAILYILVSSFFSPDEGSLQASTSPTPSSSVSATAVPEETPAEETAVASTEPSASATPEATPEPSESAANPQTYTIQKGDTMNRIVTKFYKDVKLVDAFSSYNNISDPSKIQPGQVLKIPSIDSLR